MYKSTLISIALFTTAALASECPSGWTFDQATSNCYMVSQRSMAFEEAQNFCDGQGSQLTSIYNSLENSTLTALTSSMFIPPWTGAVLDPIKLRWKWIDGAFFSSVYWVPGEPAAGYSCAVYRSSNPAGLKAAPCYSQQPALCKKKMNLCNSASFSGFSGNFSSPGYPVQYYNNLDCQYTISAPNTNTYITITFNPYYVENTYDYVTIYNGDSPSPQQQIARYSNSSSLKPPTFESSSSKMTVVFHTDSQGTDRGWFASWAAKPDYKPIYQNGTGGEMTSPNYPSSYDPFTEQQYQIQVDNGYKISATLDSFETEPNYDVLVVYDSPTVDSSKIIANVSGFTGIAPRTFFSTGPSLTMMFTSDGQLQGKGWHMTWNRL